MLAVDADVEVCPVSTSSPADERRELFPVEEGEEEHEEQRQQDERREPRLLGDQREGGRGGGGRGRGVERRLHHLLPGRYDDPLINVSLLAECGAANKF